MDLIKLTGTLAAICTTAAYLPQAWRAWRTRSTHDVSLKMYLIMVVGTALWLAYGLALGDWPLIGANSICLLLTGFILVLKLRHG
jgi:MtN3 and saliva related transmembrane protein